MKKLTFLTAVAFTSLLASACTVTVGEKFDDDDSDFVDDADDDDFVDDADDFSDDSEDASEVETTAVEITTDEDTSQDTDEESDEETSEGASQAETSSSTAAQDAGADETTSTEAATTSEDSTSSGEPVNPEPDQCEPPGEPYSCAECMHFHCSVEWSDCCGDPECVATWAQITACVANPMSDEPIDDVDRCAGQASPTGDQLDLPENVQFLMSCVGAEFMGEDDLYGHQPGEGTCTLYCYGVEAIFPPEE